MKKHSTQSSKPSKKHSDFTRSTLQILGIFVVWALYRILFHFPEWVDEGIAKALVFGIPVWLYCRSHRRGEDRLGLSNKHFWPGMFLGLLIGGLYQFLAITVLITKGGVVASNSVLNSPMFGYIFFLALLTAWWETLFFFGYVLNVFYDAVGKREIPAVFAALCIFLLFHAPLRFIESGFSLIAWQHLALLGVFAVGQAILYFRSKSVYAVTISHAMWGLMLLVYAV
ncbi:MAG TPA: hypothetical protein DCX25_01990 [Candidatus Pacebacteria bacterium]|nr:MAG: hypothetical protein UX00_C0002G0063 [Microgenomates group bacterium GW2011_GWB1_45_17]KKU23139.1 MAG: hypothetical protein UX35_C0010G0057 [Microgenomates group bacterium GW2011_GWA1_46_15]KKU23802.1 MAG: hypothetical protein UX36_C0003G0102 [Microgenomates group bacterium GW2011_GWC1_46_15]HAV15076.1 hypothetical protein [Candidatus Paceibacterota bacterium]HCR11664.1 hypothetical protein [Candidatus Paceibacterota bacterium]